MRSERKKRGPQRVIEKLGSLICEWRAGTSEVCSSTLSCVQFAFIFFPGVYLEAELCTETCTDGGTGVVEARSSDLV